MKKACVHTKANTNNELSSSTLSKDSISSRASSYHTDCYISCSECPGDIYVNVNTVYTTHTNVSENDFTETEQSIMNWDETTLIRKKDISCSDNMAGVCLIYD